MKIPWSEERCVICLGRPDPADPLTRMTDAHVISESIGGKLSADFLCDRCNSTLGGKVEGGILSDPGIRLAIEAVADELPDNLLKEMRKRQRWFAETELGQVEATMTAEGELAPRESPSLLTDENAKAMLESEWREHGLSEEEIREHLDLFDAAYDEIVELPGFTVRPKTSFSPYNFQLPLDEDFVSELFPLGVAYLYLALFFEDKLYSTEQLQPVRDALRTLDPSPSPHWSIEGRIDARGAAPWHGLAVKDIGPPLVVHVQLFQEHVWWVTLQGVAMTSQPPRYGVHLPSGDEFPW